MSRRQIESLMAMTRAILDSELAALRNVTARAAKIEAQISALDARRSVERATDADVDIPAEAQAEIWRTWASREKARMNGQLAKVLSEREAQRLRTEHAFGRAEAIKSLDERRDIEARNIARRRRPFEG